VTRGGLSRVLNDGCRTGVAPGRQRALDDCLHLHQLEIAGAVPSAAILVWLDGVAVSRISMNMRRILLTLCAVAAFGAAALAANIASEQKQVSVCYGDVMTGRLERGQRLPYSGENYRAYSMLGFAAGRTYVHSTVRDIMRDAYAELAKSRPDLRFVYGESGWASGGNLRPHKGHANGTAADFFVPVRTLEGKVAQLATSPLNLFGYAINFDRDGRSGSNALDFEAMALHLLALDRVARAHGIAIRRVIFDVNLQPKLAATSAGAQAMKRISFNRQQSWVRHDEHYHVDFGVRCL
jgi:penicillin-insensitive murein endopeptidase